MLYFVCHSKNISLPHISNPGLVRSSSSGLMFSLVSTLYTHTEHEFMKALYYALFKLLQLLQIPQTW